eukprot:1178544-Prorocentrum_minimum.AAC.2
MSSTFDIGRCCERAPPSSTPGHGPWDPPRDPGSYSYLATSSPLRGPSWTVAIGSGRLGTGDG